MGLDGVEIIMRTEETFGIEIPDKVAQQILSPAALVDFVAANVPLKSTEECLSQQMFYRLRRGFRSQVKALSSTFDLNTPLKEILHKDQWPQVRDAIPSVFKAGASHNATNVGKATAKVLAT